MNSRQDSDIATLRSRRERRSMRRVVIPALAVALISGATAGARPAAASAPDAVSWGPVHHLWAGGPQNSSAVTTDSGMVVAAWNGPHFGKLWVAVRLPGQGWSQPVNVGVDSASLSLVKDGLNAWVTWQNFDSVNALEVTADGAVGSPVTVGPSSDGFYFGPVIATGKDGAVAAAWLQDRTVRVAYRTPAGTWLDSEVAPATGYIAGLVVGASGEVELVTESEGVLSYLRRSPDGTWGAPRVLSDRSLYPAVAGDRSGDLVVGWEVDNGDGTYSLEARYRGAAKGFGPMHTIAESVADVTYVRMAMAANGAAVATYAPFSESLIRVTTTDVSGDWLGSQRLQMTATSYGVTTNAAGRFVVWAETGSGLQTARCDEVAMCSDVNTDPATSREQEISTSLGPGDAINLVWVVGCKGEDCKPTRILAQRGH